MFIEKRPSVACTPTLKALYLKHLTLVPFSLYYVDVSVYPLIRSPDFVDKYIKEFLRKILAPKTTAHTISKRDHVIVLPYLGSFSLQNTQEEII